MSTEDNPGQGSGIKRRKMDIITEPENDGSVSAQMDIITEPENDSSVPWDIMSDPEDDSFDDYCKPSDIRSLWRPPKPKEDGIWVPSCVKTNGEGRERLRRADPLVEIFDIEVDLSGRTKTYGNIHGNIMLMCAGYKTVLFNSDKKSALMIQQKGSLPLKGSDVAPLAFDSVGIFLNLKIDDDELCEDVVIWDPRYSSTDVWLYDTKEGRNGSVHVTLAVMKEAWLAELDVKLIESTKKVSSMIHGDIVVYINNMQHLRYFAFSKRSGDGSLVEPQESIPLSRSLFSCRYGSSLVVRVDLWDSDTNQALAGGALLFPPEYFGDSVGTVSGPCGLVEVKVNWARYMNHSKTREALRL